MSLKDNVNAMKEELSAEEQFLESVIKAEGFWKKYKTLIISVATIVILALLAKVGMEYMHQKDITESNLAYNALLKDSGDTNALNSLKKSNPKLYELYLFSNSTKANDAGSLEKIATEVNDPIMKELLSYQIASLKETPAPVDTTVAKEFSLLQKAYLLLKSGKIKEGDALLEQIPTNSSLRELVTTLKHYRGN